MGVARGVRRVGEPVRRVVRAAGVEHLARADEIVERAQRLLLGHRDVLHVDLVEIDAIGAQPAQRVVAALDDAVAPRAGATRPVAHRESQLRREPDLAARATPGEPPAQLALAAPALAGDAGW